MKRAYDNDSSSVDTNRIIVPATRKEISAGRLPAPTAHLRTSMDVTKGSKMLATYGDGDHFSAYGHRASGV